MPAITDLINPVELSGFIRGRLANYDVNKFTLSRWLPNLEVHDLQVRFKRGTTALWEAAQYRGFNTEAPIGARETINRITQELPPISQKIPLEEYDNLRLRNADEEIKTQLFNDADRMLQAVLARVEMARGEMLRTGKVVLSENGVIATVDLARNAGHTVTAGTLWTNTGAADPLGDMLTWRDTYIATNGVPPGACLVSSTVLANMLRNANIRALAGRGSLTPVRASRSDLDSILLDYELPPIVIYDTQVKVAGAATRIFPTTRFVFLPAPDEPLGNTFWGVTATALELGFSQQIEAGIVAVVLKHEDPVTLWTKAEGIVLPIAANTDLTFEATVG